MKKKAEPLVSIIIPVYNGSNYIEEAIESALAQTYKNTEILVVNDGSDDFGKTDIAVRKYGDKIRYFVKANGGVSTALNLGIKNMRGEYFSWLSHDDKYTPQKIENQVNSILSTGEVRIVAYCNSLQIDKDSNKLIDLKRNKKKISDKIYSSCNVLESLLQEGCFNGCALLIPKIAFNECGEFDENLRYIQDLMMWYKIFISGYNIVYQESKDVMMRIHDEQLTQTGRDLFMRESNITCNYLIFEFNKLTDNEYNFLYQYAHNCAKNNNPFIVNKCIEVGRCEGKISKKQIIILRLICMYGKVRPWIRRLYYGIFKKVKTK